MLLEHSKIEKWLHLAKTAAKKAGEVHKKYFRKALVISTKSASYDLVSEADIDAEKMIVAEIKKYAPDHNFLTEENPYPKTGSPYTWIIDPLDGTNNFVFGLPIFCVSIALAYKKEVQIAAIYDPNHDELFHALKGRGTFLNDQAMSVRRENALEKSMLITGFYYNRGKDMRRNLRIIEKFFEHPVLGIRRLGSAALDLCYVACGRATGFWEFGLSPWDFAAGILLVKEAGGRITTCKNQEINFMKKSDILASNNKIHTAMLKIIQTYD